MPNTLGPDFSNFDPAVAESMVAEASRLGGLPSYLGISLERFEPGRLVAWMDVRDELCTGFGALHGGAMAAFVDHVLGCVLYPLMPRGRWAATTEFKLNYLAPVKSGRLRAESVVLSLGRRSAVVRVEVTNGERLVCSAQGTLLISEPPGARGTAAKEDA